MSRATTTLLVISLLGVLSCNTSQPRRIPDTTNQDNWQTSGSVILKDSLLTLSGPDARAILKKGNFRNFDLRLQVLTRNSGKATIGFHTDNSGKGYQIAINNDNNDPVWWRKTGSLLSVRNLTKSFVKEDEWFEMHLRVEGQAITVNINGETVVEYIEPENPFRISPNERALLSEGTISLLSSGNGIVEFKNILIETLDRKDINVPAQLAIAKDEFDDEILRLHQEDFPVLDYHVHLKGGFTKEAAAKQSRKTGINYTIAPNCGIGFPITNDEVYMTF